MAEQLELETTQTGSDDIRSALTAAVDAAEKADSTPEKVESVQASEINPPPKEGVTEQEKADKAERERNEKGQFVKKDGDTDGKVASAAVPDAQLTQNKPVAAVTTPPAMSTDGAKPPSSWRPAAREHFSKLPPEVQEEAIRIDREVRRTMQESAEARQAYQQQRQIAEQFPVLRAIGQNPNEFLHSALQTVSALANGPQQTKAEVLASMIKTYGVDIPTLAAILDGQPAPASQPAVYRDPRVDQLLQTVEQAKAQREQQLSERAAQEIKEVENEEYFWDVKDDMADLLDLAANRNLALTPREAYNRAVLMHPEISKVLQQRQVAQAAVNPDGSTQRAKAAASSVRGSPSAPAPQNGELDLRAQLSKAWDDALSSR